MSEFTVTYEGTGRVPEQLVLRIIEEHEGDFDTEAALNAAEPIVLAPQE